MLAHLKDREEIILIDNNKERILELRSKLLKNFEKVWLFVHVNLEENIYGLEVANVWGNKLSTEKQNNIKAFVEQFMIENDSVLLEKK